MRLYQAHTHSLLDKVTVADVYSMPWMDELVETISAAYFIVTLALILGVKEVRRMSLLMHTPKPPKGAVY